MFGVIVEEILSYFPISVAKGRFVFTFKGETALFLFASFDGLIIL